MVNKYTLRWLYLSEFVKEIDYFAKSLSEKVLPAFNDIQEEAERIQAETEERLNEIVDPETADPADIAESAYHAGVDFYILADGITQGITNMFAAGLYHLFEQQFLKLHRQELLMPYGEENEPSLLALDEALRRLLTEYKVDVSAFSTWSRICELKLVANCIKHADGPSCEKLKVIRPDLFIPQSMKGEKDETGFVGSRGPVYQPLAGEGLYVGLDDFKIYVGVVKEFWNEFGNAFDQLQ